MRLAAYTGKAVPVPPHDNRRLYFRGAIAPRFWAQIHIRSDDECWLWGGTMLMSGYGRIYWRGKNWRAHRLMWTLTHGSIPEGLLICHHCDNKRCCNPAHLFIGTNADNMNDRIPKARKRGAEKLTDADVLEIRARRTCGELLESIAIDFPVQKNQIGRICRRIQWKHI